MINYQIAWVEAQRGAIDAALAALERAYASREWLLIRTAGDRFSRPCTPIPAFAAFVTRLDYPK